MIAPELMKDYLNLPEKDLSSELDRMRAKQQAYIDKHQGKPIKPNDFTLEYIDKISKKVQQSEVSASDVSEKFKEFISKYEVLTGKKWNIPHAQIPTYKAIIKNLLWIINGWSTQGIAIIGESGKGKTTIIKNFYLPTYQYFKKKFIPIVLAETLIDRKEEMVGSTHAHVAIEDLGKEFNSIAPDKNGWMPSKQDISGRVMYILDRRLMAGRITHITSNLNAAELTKTYGDRAQWRFDEMFQFINF